MDPADISSSPSIFERCRNTRQQLLDLVSRIEGPQKAALSDTMERFMLWAGNLGAMRRPSSKLSLDQRLAKAPEVQGLICRHLDDICEALDDLSGILSRANIPDDNDVKSPDQDAEDDEPFDEAGMILELIAEAISSLFRLGILVRKDSPTDRFKRALQMSDAAFNDAFDIGYVRDKYPKMSNSDQDWLPNRLGRLISQRRLFIQYSRDHKVRLEFEESPPGDLPEHQATQTERLSSKATTFHLDRLPVAVLAPSLQTGPGLEDADEEDVDEVMSVMSASTMSNSLSVLRLPALADLSGDGEPFECPICFTLQHFQREKAWRVHAFRDLKAYACTAGGSNQCDGEYFGDRNTWFEHELYQHRSQYTCTLCSAQEPISHDFFLHHMATHHPQVSGHHLRAVEDASRQNPTHFDANDCPFCDDWADQIRKRADLKGKRPATLTTSPNDPTLVSATRFKRHVALHQEQLAIFALPRTVEDGEQANEDETDKSIHSFESFHYAPTDYSLVLSLNSLAQDLHSLKETALSLVQKVEGHDKTPPRVQAAYDSSVKQAIALQVDIIRRIEQELKLLRDGNGPDPLHMHEFRRLSAEIGSNLDLLKIPFGRGLIPDGKDISNFKRRARRAQKSLFNIISQHHGVPTAVDFLGTNIDPALGDDISSLSSGAESEANSPYLSAADDALSSFETELEHGVSPPAATVDETLGAAALDSDSAFGSREDQPWLDDAPAKSGAAITIRFLGMTGHQSLNLEPGSSWQEANAAIQSISHTRECNPMYVELIRVRKYELRVTRDPLSRSEDYPLVNQDNWNEWAKPGSVLVLLPAPRESDEDEQSPAKSKGVAKSPVPFFMDDSPDFGDAFHGDPDDSLVQERIAAGSGETVPKSKEDGDVLSPENTKNTALERLIVRATETSEAARLRLGSVQYNLDGLSQMLLSCEASQHTSELSQLALETGQRASILYEDFQTSTNQISKFRNTGSTVPAETLDEIGRQIDDRTHQMEQILHDMDKLKAQLETLLIRNSASEAPGMSQIPSSQILEPENSPPRHPSQLSMSPDVQSDKEEASNSAVSQVTEIKSDGGSTKLETRNSHWGNADLFPEPDLPEFMHLKVLNNQGLAVPLRAWLDPRVSVQNTFITIDEKAVRDLGLKPVETSRKIQISARKRSLRAWGYIDIVMQNPYQEDQAMGSYRLHVASNFPEEYDIFLNCAFIGLAEEPDGESLTSKAVDNGSLLEDLPTHKNPENIEGGGDNGSEALIDPSQLEPPPTDLDDIFSIWVCPVHAVTHGRRNPPRRASAVCSTSTKPIIHPETVLFHGYRAQQLQQPVTIAMPSYFSEPYQATQYVDMRVSGNPESSGGSVKLRFYLCDKLDSNSSLLLLTPDAVQLMKESSMESELSGHGETTLSSGAVS